MFSLLMRKPRIRYEEVLPAIRRVWYRGLDGDSGESLGVEFSDGRITIYNDGEFFVMNGNGKTVAKYSLNTPPPPEEST